MKTKTFSESGVFKANWAAEKYLTERGFSVGSSQGQERRGILYGEYQISKWRGMNRAEIAALHGVMRGDGRNGPVYIDLYDHAPAEAQEAFDLAMTGKVP